MYDYVDFMNSSVKSLFIWNFKNRSDKASVYQRITYSIQFYPVLGQRWYENKQNSKHFYPQTLMLLITCLSRLITI